MFLCVLSPESHHPSDISKHWTDTGLKIQVLDLKFSTKNGVGHHSGKALPCFLGCFYLVGFFVQSLGCVGLFVTPWTAAYQASLSFTICWSLLKLTLVSW